MEDSYTFDGSIISFSTLSSRATSPARHLISGRVPSTGSLQHSEVLAPRPSSSSSLLSAPVTRENSPQLTESLEVSPSREAPPQIGDQSSRGQPESMTTSAGHHASTFFPQSSLHGPETFASSSNSPRQLRPHQDDQIGKVESRDSDEEGRATHSRTHTADSANVSVYDELSGSGESNSSAGSALEDNDLEDDLEGASHNLLMPSMRISHNQRATERPYRRNLSVQTDLSRLDISQRKCSRILILGKTCEQRATLAKLLDDLLVSETGGGDDASSLAGETDMSASFCSAPVNDRFRDTGRALDAPELASGIFSYLSSHTTHCKFAQISSENIPTNEIVQHLTTALEHMESMINPNYPPCAGLLQLIEEHGVGEFDAALLLMSSPPTASEVALARCVSHALPVVPVLILPPCSRPQKTGALLQAVTQQLTTAGVCWTPTTGNSAGRQSSSVHLLPNDLFAFPFVEPAAILDSAPASSPALPSLAASQELLPPSPGRSLKSRSSSSSSLGSGASGSSSSRGRSRARNPSAGSRYSHFSEQGDLRRLRSMFGTATGVEQLRHARALAFLDWRDIELAAHGQALDPETVAERVMQLPSAWKEAPVERVTDRSGPSMLDFSKRVAERRSALASRNHNGRAESALHRPHLSTDQSASSDEQIEDRESQAGGYFASRRHQSQQHQQEPSQAHSSILTELVATPRPPLPCPPSSNTSSSSASSMYPASDPAFPLHSSPYNLSASSSTSSSLLGGEGSVTTGSMLLHAADPFHLPSLLHLVGLNIRLALLPISPGHASQDQREYERQNDLEDRGGVDNEKALSDSVHDRRRGSKRQRHLAARVTGSGWLGTAALCGFMFLAGVACGVVTGGGASSRVAGEATGGAGSGGAALRLGGGVLRGSWKW